MSFLKTVAEEEAEGDVAELYVKDIERIGYLHNYIRTFSLHPDAYQAWRGLVGAIAKSMDERRYELATFSAANRLRSSYCSLAHGQVLVDKFLEPSVVEDLVEDPASTGLDEAETLIVQFAAKVAEDATRSPRQTSIVFEQPVSVTGTSSTSSSPPLLAVSSPRSSTPPGPWPIPSTTRWNLSSGRSSRSVGPSPRISEISF